MMIPALVNDVSKKRELWNSFAKKNNCIFKFKQTPHREINILKMECFFREIKINFEETDAKPFICQFDIKIHKNTTIEIGELTIFDKLSFVFKRNDNLYNHPFLTKHKIKSNNTKILYAFLKDDSLLNLMNNSEFFGLYAYTKRDILKVRITSSYFVNSDEKLTDIYTIVGKIIDIILQV